MFEFLNRTEEQRRAEARCWCLGFFATAILAVPACFVTVHAIPVAAFAAVAYLATRVVLN